MNHSDATLEQRLAALERAVNPKPPGEFFTNQQKDSYIQGLHEELALVAEMPDATEERLALIRAEIARAGLVDPDYTIEYDEDGTERHVPFMADADA